jgi:hypothetical protein
VILCYEAGNAEEAVRNGRRIQVRIGSRKPSTVPHFLGQALGVPTLTANDKGFTANIMWEDPSLRGDKLTLGQVFRMHVPLSTAMPRCDTGPCPSLEAIAP